MSRRVIGSSAMNHIGVVDQHVACFHFHHHLRVGRFIWHDAQFSVSTRLTGYSRYGGGFNYLGEGNFFGQIREIRISNVRRYGR